MSEVNRNVPEFRFTGFTNEWSESSLKSLLIEYKLGGNYSNSEQVSKFPLIKMGNLGRGHIVLKKIQYIPSDEEIDANDLIKYGDLFFNTRNTLELVGKVAIWRNELTAAYYNSNLMRMEYENNFFMNYRLNSFEGIKSLRRIATGTTSVAAIYTKDFLKVHLKVPCAQEQQKIADCLSSVDKKIQQLTEKHRLISEYKKGVMQQIFTQKIRFKDPQGNDYPGWEEKSRCDVAKFSKGKDISKSDIVAEGKLPCIRYGELYTHY
jgi:type I restriction enzyme S subunit